MSSICIVTPDLAGPTRNGGIGTHCLYLTRFLARRGDQVTIVHTCTPDDLDRETWRQTYRDEHGAALFFLDELPGEPDGPLLPHTTRNRTAHHVFRWLRGQHFDVVHFQDWQGNGAICVRAKRTGLAFGETRLVVTTHGSSEWIRSGMYQFPTDGRESLIDDVLERTAVALADTVVCPSEYMLDWLRAHGWRLPDDVVVAPYLFEAPAPAPPRGLEPGQLEEIVFFGRLETRKGLEPFLGAVRRLGIRLHSSAPGRTRRVHFLGREHLTQSGPALELINATAASTNGAFRFEVHSVYDHRTALNWLQARPHALVVMPSVLDNLPFAVIESLALGQPTLTSNRGGIPEIVGSPEHLVEPNETALAERLHHIIEHGLPACTPRYQPEAARAAWTAIADRPRPQPAPSPAPLRVSVCVPFFNQPENLATMLELLARQSLPPHEVIVVDDGSDPRHDAAWQEIVRTHQPRGWKFLRQKNAGPSAARNAAAGAATGDAIVFCDQDNRPGPDLLARLERALQVSSADIVTCAFTAHRCDASGAWNDRPEYTFCPIGSDSDVALLENFVGDNNFIVRREVFTRLGGFDPANRGLSEDWEFLLRASFENHPIAILPEPVFAYRLDPASLARRRSEPAACEAAWQALSPVERARYRRLLLTARGTFAAVAELKAAAQAAHVQLQATQQHVRNVEALNAQLKRDMEGMRAAINAANQLREQLKEMGLARDQAAHDLAHQKETLEIARQELQVQEQRRQEMERRLNRTRDENTRLRRIIEERDRKIRHMQESLSWRSTAPLRAIRRKFVDRYLAAGGTQTSPLEEIDAPYLISLDVPSVWDAAPAVGSFSGWCVSTRGVPARAIRAIVGANEFSGRYGIRRADVALAHKFTSPDAAQCGFQIPYRLLVDVDYQVVIEVQTADGIWVKVFERVLHTSSFPRAVRDYTAWVESFGKPTPERVGSLRARLARLPASRRPLLSVLLPVYNPPEAFLERAVESVRSQIYEHWELCIADDSSTAPHVRLYLDRIARDDPRVRVVYRSENGHISRASNSALELARGDYVVLLDHDDELSWDALAEVAIAIAGHPDTDVLYSDEDKIDEEGRRFDPYFKPDFLPDLLAGQNCLSHLSVFRTKLVRDVGGFREGFEGSQDWDLALRVIDATSPDRVRHIPKVLYHWRAISGSTAIEVSEKRYSLDAARRALQEHFRRRGIPVEVHPVPGAHWRVIYPLPARPPLVSIVIPTRNAARLLRTCVDSLFNCTEYEPFEIVIVNNRSNEADALALFRELSQRGNVRVIDYDAPFNFSAIINYGVSKARGEIVVLLNNDIEATDPGWLREMVSHAVRPEIGAVGAMLYYPDETIQHAGIVLGLGGVANHAFGHHAKGTDGYKNRARLVQNYSAVTAACLAIRRELFLHVGGFNEIDLPIAFNDVDFCIRVRNAGYRNLWTPFAELIHHESISRGREDTPEKQARFEREVAYMRATWGEQLDRDPAYNVNLALSMEGWDLAWPPRS